MFLNYLRIALRQIRRNTLYSVVNVFCLAVGITVALTVLLYVLHEHSYDRWHAGSERIVKMASAQKFGAEVFFNDRMSIASGPAALQADGAVRSMTRLFPAFLGQDLQNGTDPSAHFRETNDLCFADSNFFQFFSFRLLRGSAATVLSRPFTAVLTETEAKKYFGMKDPMGKTLVVDNRYTLKVTGVAADIPSNSSIRFGLLTSIATMTGMEKYQPYIRDERMGYGSFYTWMSLRDITDTAKVERSLTRKALEIDGGARDAGQSGAAETHQYRLYPLAGEHLRYGGTSGRYLGPLMLVAIVILLLALVNYMSLATSRAAARAKEVGVRKVLGAGRMTLAGQFYMESAIFAVAAFAFGGILFLWLKGYFYQLMQVKIADGFVSSPVVLGFFAGLFGLIVLIAGSYPSLVLSRFRPVAVLYGRLSRQMGGERMRKIFIVLQFSISMALVICSFVIGKQLYYIRHTDTGIDRENVVMFPFAQTMDHYPAFRKDLGDLPGVKNVATTMFKLYAGPAAMAMMNVPGRPAPVQGVGLMADSNFIPLVGMKWKDAPVAGSSWTGQENVVLNEEAVSLFGLQSQAIGRQVRIDDRLVTVKGVLKNFNFYSLHEAIQPFAATIVDDPTAKYPEGSAGCFYVKIGAHQNIPRLIEAVRKIYSKYDKRTEFQFQFLDEAFDKNYKQEDQLAGLMDVFTVITVFIACLGLFALATFAARQRVKEIGVRKILGASVGSIGVLLSRDFLRPVLLAVMIACPLAWWLMNRWLQDFAFRTKLSWWVFGVGGLGLLGIALATVLFRSLQAAQANPVENLREP